MELESSVKSKECTSKSFVLRLRSQNNSLTHAFSIDKCANDWIVPGILLQSIDNKPYVQKSEKQGKN